MSIISVKDKLNISRQVISFLSGKSVFSENDNQVHFLTGSDKRPSSHKLILVNVLYAMEDEEESDIYGTLNINVQDDDPVWIEYISEVVNLFIDESVIDGYRLSYSNEHLFKVSKDLFFKNLKFKFCTI